MAKGLGAAGCLIMAETIRDYTQAAAESVGRDTSHSANEYRLALDPPVDALWVRDSEGLCNTGWNPWEDDGHAFRLGVAHGLAFGVSKDGQAYVWLDGETAWEMVWDETASNPELEEERRAALRRAIVRAAGVVLDRQKEEQKNG